MKKYILRLTKNDFLAQQKVCKPAYRELHTGQTPASALFSTLLFVVLASCGGTPAPRPSIDKISPPTNLSVESSSITNDGKTWQFRAGLNDDIPVIKATLYYKDSGKQIPYRQKRLESKNGLESLIFETDTDDADMLQYYIVLEDAEGKTYNYGDSTNPVLLRVKQAPAQPEKNAAAGKIQYDDACKKPSLLQKIPAKAYVTKNTRKDGSKDIPYGNTGRINLNDGQFFPYVELRRLQIREYDYVTRLYDGDGKIVYRGNSSFSNKQETMLWTSWVSYTPSSSATAGEWTFLFCEGGYRQAEKRFTTYRR